MTVPNIQLDTQLLPAKCRHVYIAYSGGIDSQVLLHLCANISDFKNKIIAVYINHGLQEAANEWERHCEQQCRQLSVQFKAISVYAKANNGESPEAAARNARYTALQALLEIDDALFLAQHREDQLETVLLQLFRGGGLQGLAAMPVCMNFGKGFLLRPLLNTSKQEILAYADLHELQWVDDPSNLSNVFDRNFLRNQVLPLLKTRWPALDKTVARTAIHCANAVDLLNSSLAPTLEALIDPLDQSLLLANWQLCPDNQKKWLLRAWLQKFVKPPSEAVLQSIINQLIFARDDALPQVLLQGYSIRKYRQKLFCLPLEYLHTETYVREWPQQNTEISLLNSFNLLRIASDSGIDKQLWESHTVTISPRRGGEKINLPGRNGQHSLKKLYQEKGIPPWERDLRPLVYLDKRLAAVAGLWVADWAWRPQGDCYRISWQTDKVKCKNRKENKLC